METSTTISMPKFSADGNITIEGDDISKVIEARHKLHYVVSQIRKRHGVLQFISIPLLSDQIKENFLKFKVVCKLFVARLKQNCSIRMQYSMIHL